MDIDFLYKKLDFVREFNFIKQLFLEIIIVGLFKNIVLRDY